MRGSLMDIPGVLFVVLLFSITSLAVGIILLFVSPALVSTLDYLNNNVMSIELINLYKFDLPIQIIQILDKFVLYYYVFSFLVATYLATKVKTEPVYFVFCFIPILASLILSYGLSLLWNEISKALPGYVSLFPTTTLVMMNLQTTVIFLAGLLLYTIYVYSQEIEVENAGI